jgi:DHA2 family multidrug resistance protein
VPSAIAAANTGRISDRIGLRWLLFACALGAALLTFPQALARGFTDLLLLRLAAGLFLGGMFPAAHAIVSQSAPPERRATAFGVSASATLIGQASGPIAAGLLVAGSGLREVFFLSGGFLLAASLLVGIAVRDPEAGRSFQVAGARGAHAT